MDTEVQEELHSSVSSRMNRDCNHYAYLISNCISYPVKVEWKEHEWNEFVQVSPSACKPLEVKEHEWNEFVQVRRSLEWKKKIKESSQDPNYKSSFSIKDDLLSQVIGPKHPGCVRGLGFGATSSNINAQLQVVSWKQAMNNKVNEVMERQKVMEEIISQLTSTMSHRDDNGNLEGKPCKLLHWIASGEVVAYGEISSTRSFALVDDVPLGTDCYKDMSQPTPTQESAAKDLHGFEWRLKHKFRGSLLAYFSFI
ncbi:hypothetical protein Sjap_001148 [Stephania japonica]|uniref:Uncharacterized protein n=1 Tax=Stephania japonica TaxID=461633 RepID=A0AAP0PR72_9MAGN